MKRWGLLLTFLVIGTSCRGDGYHLVQADTESRTQHLSPGETARYTLRLCHSGSDIGGADLVVTVNELQGDGSLRVTAGLSDELQGSEAFELNGLRSLAIGSYLGWMGETCWEPIVVEFRLESFSTQPASFVWRASVDLDSESADGELTFGVAQ